MPATALQGICPECMLKVGLFDTAEVGPEGTGMEPRTLLSAPSVEEIAPHFPQLEILKCLGRGGMGAVYQARQPRLDRWVALKILSPEKQGDPKFAERFAREAQALARLNHPNIVAVHDFGEVPGHFYLLMEYVNGLSLRQLLSARRLAPEQVLNFVPRICEALQFAHEHGVVHRDIKPENILIDQQDRLKIADFGIAKIVEPIAPSLSTPPGPGAEVRPPRFTEGQVVGTPHYMAPEQVEDPQRVDHRADVFSLGVVFYEMLTGELPLGKFEPPSCRMVGTPMDARLDRVVLRALEKDPNRRYQHAGDVKTDLDIIASTDPQEPGSIPDEAAPRDRAWWGRTALWSARILGTLLLLFYSVFVLAEGLPPIASQPGGVQLNFAALALMLAGFLVGWRHEGTAAVLICSGWTVWHISESQIQLNFFQTPLPVAALYTLSWWEAHRRNSLAVAIAAGFLAVALILGRLFVPSNVFIHGTVTDAVDGTVIANAALSLLPAPQASEEGGPRPDARTDVQGNFRLYVGWYTSTREVVIAAPGYSAWTTNLGERPLGLRRLQRNYQLHSAVNQANAQAKLNAVQPVVIATWPESGTSDVDPAQSEIRVTFSKTMRDRSWSWTSLGAETNPDILGEPRYLKDRRTCVLPVGLRPGRIYALWLNTGDFQNFQDQDGRPAVPYLLIFQTGTKL